ncbi:DHH phosphoesterase [Rhodofomes roseus]|uniref:DHH phosphoesterase n=1 Tax=Rhodofomes roseus TaxID=34475 RepID=A0ABQ8JXM6_9APHY|nr:DHH phosphoesterase [Rhodofomes roseus]KAH9828950.1 DHH phosphoesterase [Rhodofomes roseus]
MRSPTPASDSSDAESGDWPAYKQAMSAASAFIQECASARRPTLLLPDKDADGLCAGLILHYTLSALGLPPALISTHFVGKGSNVHAPTERVRIQAIVPRPAYIIVADQGSRAGPAILPGEDEGDGRQEGEVRTLIVDHHLADGFPVGAIVLSAAKHQPVATSSTLAYLLCEPLVRRASPEVRARMEWLCVLGTMGDLGVAHKWERPWPDMSACMKRWTKKVLGEAVALVNAREYLRSLNVHTAWSALLANDPAQIVSAASGNKHVQRLHKARREIRAETERCGHTAPTFSGDGRVALVRIRSEAQVHPLIATRWASTLKSARLQIVICANDGYLPGAEMTNFACRIARCAIPSSKSKGAPEINIPDILREYAVRIPGLRESMGEDFARGHAQASGGIVKSEDFERLWQVMRDAPADGSGPPRKKRKVEATQKNTLEGWIKK